MVESHRTVAILVLALALVTVPVWAPPLDVTGRDYEYRSTEVTVSNNSLSIPGRAPRLTAFEDVSCFRSLEPTRRCGFEGQLVDGDTVTVDYPGVRHVSGDPLLASAERYVAFPGDGRVFRPTTGWNESRDAYVLGLERVNASRVLDEASRPLDSVRGPVRRAIESGSARVDEPLDEPRLVDTASGYAIVYETGTRSFLSEKPLTERLFETVSIIAGVALLRRLWVE
jgi:hypothetical protein